MLWYLLVSSLNHYKHAMIVLQEVRPYLATECENLHKAEKFRRQIISEISKKVAQIQNGLLFTRLKCLTLLFK